MSLQQLQNTVESAVSNMHAAISTDISSLTALINIELTEGEAAKRTIFEKLEELRVGNAAISKNLIDIVTRHAATLDETLVDISAFVAEHYAVRDTAVRALIIPTFAV